MGRRKKAKWRGGRRNCAPAKRRLLLEPLSSRHVLAASVSGMVFDDLNQNGVFEPAGGETPIAGRTVYLDLNRNERFDSATEPSQATGSDGTYRFDNLSAGSYSVGQILGANSAQTFPIGSQATIRNLDLDLNNVVYSPVTGKLYATVYSGASQYANSLLVINPTTASVESSLFVGDNPGLAISDDAQFAYLPLGDQPAVQRVNLNTMTPDLRFTLGSDVNGPFYALDLAVMPGNPHTVAITRYSRQIQPGLKGIAIYDDGVPRPQTTSQFDDAELLTFSDSPSTLYAYNDIVSGSDFYKLAVTASGVSIIDDQKGLVNRFEYDAGRIYATGGRVVDPQTDTLLGTFPVQKEFGESSPVESISNRGLTFFLGNQQLQAFDSQTLLPVASLDLPTLTGNELRLIRFGNDGLAYTGADGLTLINWDPRPALQHVTLTTDSSAQDVNFGDRTTAPSGSISGRVYHDLDSSASQDAGEPGVAAWTVYADQNGNGQLDAGEPSTLTDAAGNYVLNGLPPHSYTVMIAGRPGWVQTTPTQQQTGRVQQLELTVNEMVYDPLRGKIYAAIPGRIRGIGNTVTEIDPVSGKIGRSVYVGSEPRSLSLSDDGKYLYVGLEGAGAVRRVDLATFAAGLQFSLGNNFSGPYFPSDVQVLPGSNSAVAVSSQPQPNWQIGVAVYDDGVQRPTTTPRSVTGAQVLTGSASPSILYGQDGDDLVRLNVSAQGISVGSTAQNILGLTYGIKYDNGRIYGTNGKIFDAATFSLLGTYAATGWWVEPVSSTGLTFFVANGTIRAFDQNTLALVGTVTLPGADIRADNLIHWGDHGLAYSTDQGHVVLVEWDPRDPQFTTPLPVHLTAGQQAAGPDFGILNTSPINPPLGVADNFTTTEDVGFALAAPGVLANDLDVDNPVLTAVLVSGPAHGTLTLNMDGSFSYTPQANFHGSDSFTYRANDNQGLSPPTTVSINVSSVNDVPVATGETYTTPQDTPRIVTASGVLANDFDGDSDALTSILETRTAHGSLLFNSDGSFSYTPDARYSGTDRFSYRASDGQSLSRPATVTINITAVNNAPVAAGDSYSATQDTPLAVAAPGVLANDADVEASVLTSAVVSSPSHGSLALTSSGAFTYTPAAGYAGPDSFTYRARDGQLNSNTVTVSLNVLPANPAAVSGRLFEDLNQDGVFDPATEQLLAGRTVFADLNDNGSFDPPTEPSQVTATDGSYAFTGLPPGPMRVSQVLPTGWRQTSPTSSSNIFAVMYYGGRNLLVEYTRDGKRTQSIVVPAPPSQSGVWSIDDAVVDAAGRIHVFQNTLTEAYISTYSPWTRTWEHHTFAGFRGSTQLGADKMSIGGDYLYTGLTRFNINDWSYTVFTPPNIFGGFTNVILGANGKLYAHNAGSPINSVCEFDPNTFALLRTIGLRDEQGNGVGVGAVTAQGDFFSVAGNRVLHFDPNGVLLGSAAFTTGTWSTIDVNLSADGYLAIGEWNGRLALVKTDFSESRIIVVTPGVCCPPALYTSFSTYQGAGLSANSFFLNLAAGDNRQGLEFGSYFAGVNPAVVVQDDSFSVPQDTKLTVPAPGVLTNDQAPPGSSLVVSGVTEANHDTLHGSAPVNADGSVSYNPDPGFRGLDGFTYRVRSGNIDSGEVTVRITVIGNDPPVAVNNTYVTTRDVSLTVGGQGVLSNDVDGNGNALTAALLSQPQHGALTFNADGTFQYVPDTRFIGTDRFTYRVNDGTVYSKVAATVYIDVKGVNVPVATGDSCSTVEDTSLHVDAISGVLKNDSDPAARPLTASVVGPPLHGSVTLNPDGSFDYAPVADFAGTDTFIYQATGGDDPALATVTITVTGVNDPPQASPDAFVTMEEVTLTVFVRGVLANDGDIDSTSLHAVIETLPSHGVLSLNAAGNFTYTPATDFSGSDSFTYRVSDNSAASVPATVSINVVAVNDRPVAADDGFFTKKNVPLTISAPGVLSNDTDADGDGLSAIVEAGPSRGQLVLHDDGSFMYTPDQDFRGVDSFTYRASDGKTTSQPATVTLAVGVHILVARDDEAVVREDDALTIPFASLLANDSGADSDSLSVVVVDGGGPAHGQLVRTEDGALIYTPDADFNGTDVFTYYASDGDSISNVATVTVTITPVNDAPSFVIGRDPHASDESGPQTITGWATSISPGAANEAGQSLRFLITTDKPELFTALPTISPAGDLSFTPAPNAQGTTKLTVQLFDDGGTADGGVDFSQQQTFHISIEKPHRMHNAINPLDPNNDGFIAPNDVVLVVNYINAHPASGELGSGLAGDPVDDHSYVDVNGDNSVSATDALDIINFLNAHPDAGGEATASTVQAGSGRLSDAAVNDLFALLAADNVMQAVTKRRN